EKLELWAGVQSTPSPDADEGVAPLQGLQGLQVLQGPSGGPNSWSAALFEYLGFITLSDNHSTAFKSRELKSVTVPSCTARFLKLRLHKNHSNALNPHNQVGLIAINVLGQQLGPSRSGSAGGGVGVGVGMGAGPEPNNNGEPAASNGNNNNNALLLVNNPQYTSPYDDLAFEMYVDQEVARIIRTMELKKQQALAMEDLRTAGERLSKYELEKRQAIQLEDYDRAKLKKAQMDEYRHTVYRFLEVDDLLEVNGWVAAQPQVLRISSNNSINSINSTTTSIIISNSRRQRHNNRNRLNSCPRLRPALAVAAAAAAASNRTRRPFAAHSGAATNLPHRAPEAAAAAGAARVAAEEAPGAEVAEEAAVAAARRPPAAATRQIGHQKINFERARWVKWFMELPLRAARWRELQLEAEAPARSRLTDREKKQAALPLAVFGSDLQFSDKEEGLRLLKEELRAQASGESTRAPQAPPNKTARAAVFLLHRALRDKVYSVYSLAAEAIRIFFTEFVPTRVTAAEVSRSVERLLPELLSKSGDTTPRIHNMAVHTILSMADCQEVRELNLIPVHLSRPLTSSTHPRLALSRLEMVEQLVLSHGISTDKNSGLTCRTLAELGASGLHHPAEAVRKVAERVLTLVYRVNPRLVRKQLPPDDDITRRNLLYRQLFHEFDRIDIQRKKEILEKNKQAARAANMFNNTTSCPSNNAAVSTKGSGQQTGSSSSSASAITSPSDTSQHDAGDDKMCIFCLARSETFTEEGLNVHYWRSCPMLLRCAHCKQVVEIALFSQHLLEECDMKHLYKKCERCTEAVLADFFDEHVSSVDCTAAEATSVANHCPLCHTNIPPWEDGWRQHLVGLPCPNHPRKKHIKHRSKSPSDKDLPIQPPKTPTHMPHGI
ncbi:Blast:Centrosomal protein of 104 kDa, partial [Gryllus bimaculatus]